MILLWLISFILWIRNILGSLRSHYVLLLKSAKAKGTSRTTRDGGRLRFMWRFLSFFALLASKVAAFFSLLSSFAAACPRLTGQKWTRPTFKKYGNMIRNGLNPTKGILEHKVDNTAQITHSKLDQVSIFKLYSTFPKCRTPENSDAFHFDEIFLPKKFLFLTWIL